LQESIEKADLDYDELSKMAAENITKYDSEFALNHKRLLETGHNGVPTFAYENEPFFGQDRFDQLLWRMGISLPYGSLVTELMNGYRGTVYLLNYSASL